MEDQGGVSRRGLVAAEHAGRGGDRVLGHLTPGELVVPKSCQTPELMALFAKVAHAAGLDPNRFIVGSPEASRNPRTGLEEFLEGDTGGVSDTGSSSGSGGSGASGHGGENAAHGETGNQAAGYGPAGPNDGFGSYSGSAAVAGNQDALSPGFFDDPLGYLEGKAAVTGKNPGVLGWGLGMVPGVGLAMAATRALQSLTGEEGVADYGDGMGGGAGNAPQTNAREFVPDIRKRRGLLTRRTA